MKYKEPIDFEDSLRKGKPWELILSKTLESLSFIKLADYDDSNGKKLQGAGIDLLLEGKPFSVDVKTFSPSYYRPWSPVIWFETWSVPGKKRGWYYTSTANAILCHWAGENSQRSLDAFIFNLKKLRERKFLESCVEKLQLEEKVARPTNYKGLIYSSTGYLVPVSQFPRDTIINIKPLIRQYKLDEIHLLEAKTRFHSVFDDLKKG